MAVLLFFVSFFMKMCYFIKKVDLFHLLVYNIKNALEVYNGKQFRQFKQIQIF